MLYPSVQEWSAATGGTDFDIFQLKGLVTGRLMDDLQTSNSPKLTTVMLVDAIEGVKAMGLGSRGLLKALAYASHVHLDSLPASTIVHLLCSLTAPRDASFAVSTTMEQDFIAAVTSAKCSWHPYDTFRLLLAFSRLQSKPDATLITQVRSLSRCVASKYS